MLEYLRVDMGDFNVKYVIWVMQCYWRLLMFNELFFFWFFGFWNGSN